MPRTYSENLILSTSRSPSDTLGVEFARACIEARLPAKYIAEMFDVSRMTIHSWFRGSPIRTNNAKRMKAILEQVRKDLGCGRLPATGLADAKAYLRGFRNE